MNIKNKAISTYSGFNFNSIANFNGRLLGATPTGIYEIGGANDNGVAIAAKLKTGSTDFGTDLLKYLRDVCFMFRTTGTLTVYVYPDEDTASEVNKASTIVSSAITSERVKMPTGLRGYYFTIKIVNNSGADFDIDSITMLVEPAK